MSCRTDPYGNPLEQFGTLTTSLGFTGEYTDPSGQLYLRARYANPSTGTFLTRDPFEGVMMQAMSRNGCHYVEEKLSEARRGEDWKIILIPN